MEITLSMIAFFVLVASWFVLPSSSRTATTATAAASPETLASAA